MLEYIERVMKFKINMNSKKRVIYILSEFFGPFQNVGSIKFTKIAKYLSSNPENEIYVFSRMNRGLEDPLLKRDIEVMTQRGVKIFYIYAGREYLHRDIENGCLKMLSTIIHRIYRHLFFDYSFYHDNMKSSEYFVKGALKLIDEKSIPKPDAIISTYDDFGGHNLALKLKERYSDAIWIADFRDPVGVAIKSKKYRKIFDLFSWEVSKKADYVTLVSEGIIGKIQLTESSCKQICPNGYDEEDYQNVLSQESLLQKYYSTKFRLTYTGSFYGSTLIPLLKAIRELIDEHKIEKERIELCYAGEYERRVNSEVSSQELTSIFHCFGVIKRDEAIALQHNSDVLLTAVWNRHNYKGVIGGKVLNYLMLRKPIIAIVAGDSPNSEMKKLITSVKCGFCYEEATKESDYCEVKNYIYALYLEKMKKGKIEIEYDNERMSAYDLKNVARKYESLLAHHIQ